MKKLYIFLIAILASTFILNAQSIDENFDDYILGPLGSQNPDVWGVWSGNLNDSESITVSEDFASSGSQSGLIGAGPGPQDALLLLGNISEVGAYELNFNMYIPAGKTGYFNLQGQTTATGGAGNGGNGVFNSTNLVFNNQGSSSGAPGIGGAYPNIEDAEAIYTWFYPEEEWFPVSILYVISDNADSTGWTMTVNNVALEQQAFDADEIIGGIDFFGIDANNEYYIDDITFSEVIMTNVSNPILQNAQIYPNPVSDILNIRTEDNVDEVVLYDLLGRRLLSKTPATNATSLDMNSLNAGIYVLELRINDDVRSIKIVKDF